jgi:hypothetical protein
MKRLAILSLLVVGCGDAQSAAPNNDELSKLRSELAAVTAERDELSSRARDVGLAAQRASAALSKIDIAQEQKLAIGRYIGAKTEFEFLVAVEMAGGNFGDQLKAISELGQAGTKIDPTKYGNLDSILNRYGGHLPPRFALYVDWSQDASARDLHEGAIDLANRLRRAQTDDEIAMAYYENSSFQLGARGKGIIRQ